ncbi:cytochrome P450 [Phlyctema vagabunda]|uniref:Cytochrome P450 n=1 Tax=Phlyctema vagabunda TaxID=108571 RepID=A0ABR4PQA8_9HELO
MLFLFIPILLLLSYIIWTLTCLLRNYRLAQSMGGIPIVTSLVTPHTRIWGLLLRLLPSILGDSIPRPYMARYHSHGGHYAEKLKMHLEFGRVFVHVTPSWNEVHVADAAACEQILARRHEFLKPITIMGSVDIFGKSLATVEGADWQRHRKITAPPFNERNSALVWQESIRQATQMLEVWQEGSVEEGGVNSVAQDTMTLGLHVLTSAGFGQPYHFRSAKDAATNGYQLNYRDCLVSILDNLFVLFLTPSFMLNSRFAPDGLVRFRFAVSEYKRYMVEMVQLEKEKNRQGASTLNLLSALVKNSEDAGRVESKVPGRGLSDDEIYGNIFMYSLAGHESTANTIAFAIYLFVAYPQWQDWVVEEIVTVFADLPPEEVVDYEAYYPRLLRCLAVMYETLRLFGPVLSVPKTTGFLAASFPYEGSSVTVPPHTAVHVNSGGLHQLPEYWGADAQTWRPDRWITTSTAEKSERRSEETLKAAPQDGSFMPWSEGPRICPGKKFAMVEFVAVVAVLLRRWRVEVVCVDGESDDDARARVREVVESAATRITLQMRQPSRVRVRWVKRC